MKKLFVLTMIAAVINYSCSKTSYASDDIIGSYQLSKLVVNGQTVNTSDCLFSNLTLTFTYTELIEQSNCGIRTFNYQILNNNNLIFNNESWIIEDLIQNDYLHLKASSGNNTVELFF